MECSTVQVSGSRLLLSHCRDLGSCGVLGVSGETTNLLRTSWQDFKVHRTYDFTIGLPADIPLN